MSVTAPERAPDLDKLATLREPLPPHLISKLPGGIPEASKNLKRDCPECGGYHGPAGFHLDYAGHAAITDRLLEVDPLWSWEPLAFDSRGLPLFETNPAGEPIGMWIKLTVAGVTRLGFGDAVGKKWGPTAIKEVIGDAIRNAAMRFGLGLDLWHKGTLDGRVGEEDDGDGMLDAEECAAALYAADSVDAVNAVAKRYRGTKDSAAKLRIADPGTGESVTLLEFAQACRAALDESGEPLRVRRARERAERDAAIAAQDAAEQGDVPPRRPRSPGESAAQRAQRIADEVKAKSKQEATGGE